MTMVNITLEKDVYSMNVFASIVHVDTATKVLTALESKANRTHYLDARVIYNFVDPVECIKDGQQVELTFAENGIVVFAKFIYPDIAPLGLQ